MLSSWFVVNMDWTLFSKSDIRKHNKSSSHDITFALLVMRLNQSGQFMNWVDLGIKNRYK